jgi:glutaredoxin
MKYVLQTCSVLLLLCAATAHAQLYKWVGPDGKVTYSDTPPPKTASRVETKALGSGGISTSDFPFELAEAVRNAPVTLYTSRNCIPCDDGRKLLSERGIPFSEKTISSNEDLAQFKQAGGEAQLPMLLVGRARERGFEPGAWNSALSAAGYPESNKLPKTYRNPPAEAAAPAPKPATARQESGESGNKTVDKPGATALPPAIGNAPPGFRF